MYRLRVDFTTASTVYTLVADAGAYAMAGQDAGLSVLAANSLTLNSPATGTVSLSATGSVQNTGSVAQSWSIAATPAAVIAPSSGTTAPGSSTLFSVTASSPGTYSISLTNTSGGGVAGSPDSMVVSAGVVIPTIAGKYRYEQPYLFQTAPVEFEPNRMTIGVSDATRRDRRNTSPTSATVGGQWFWQQPRGDYIDGAGTRYGTAPALSIPINSGNEFTYTNQNCTAIVQQAQTGNRWLAMLWSTSGTAIRVVYGKNSAFPPSINVTYTDLTTEVLDCRITAVNNTSSSYASFGAESYSFPIFIEFDRPAKTVQSATLTFRIKSQFSGNCNLQGFLLDPQRNAEPSVAGIAYTADLDAGLTSNTDVLILHRYVDGSSLNDFKYDNPAIANYSVEASYDRAIWGRGAEELDKHPHVSYGKWIALPTATVTDPVTVSSPSAVQVSLVDSSYAGQGFAALAPGMGALKVKMHAVLDRDGLVQADGSWVGETGTGMAPEIFLPAAEFGLCQDMYVRSYIRIGTPDGGPFVDSITDRYQVHQSGTAMAPTEIDWVSKAGKCFIVPDHHCYPDGGFSATAGGTAGWQARMGWGVVDEVDGGPMEGGFGIDFHTFDIQNQPVGNYPQNYTYATNSWMQSLSHGGMGTLYAHKWYCFETRLRLNTVLPYYPGFLADGIQAHWIDGRKIIQHDNIVFRQRPVFRGLGNATYGTAVGLDQFSAAIVSGMAAGEGYVGVCVRNNRANGAYFVALVSRYSATHAVVGLAKADTGGRRRLVHLALTDPIPWADGDEIRLEAVGNLPTVLTVKQNGSPLTLKWYTGATTHPATPSTALQSATSYSDTVSNANTYVGIFACNQVTAGLKIDSWTGGEISGTTFSDSFTYADADLNVASANWTNHDTIGPLIVRSNSVHADPVHRAPSSTTVLPARELGHRNLLFNWFHGGQTLNSEDRYLFITGLVAAKQYIGPMKVPQTIPSWVPLPGEVATLTQTNGKLTNRFASQAAPYYGPFYFHYIAGSDGGYFTNPYFGTYGSLVFFGGGHATTNDNTCLGLELGYDTCTFRRFTDPTPHYGTGTDGATQVANNTAAYAITAPYSEYTVDGQPGAPHNYGSGDVIGPEHGGAASGTFIRVVTGAIGRGGFNDATACHQLDFNDTTGPYAWQRRTNNTGPTGNSIQPQQWSAHVPGQQRIYYECAAAGAANPVRWFNLATNTYEQGTGAMRSPASGPYTGVMFHCEARNLLVFADRLPTGGLLRLQYLNTTLANPGWVTASLATPVALSTDPDPIHPNGWAIACWCADNNRILIGGLMGDNGAIKEVAIPATVTDPWTVEHAPFGSGQTIDWVHINTFKKWTYNPKTKSILYMPYAKNGSTLPGDETVYVYRPRNT